MPGIFTSPPWTKQRNSGYDCLATDENIDEVLHTALPQEFAPYSLIRVYPEKKENSDYYTQNFVEAPVERYMEFREKYPHFPRYELMSSRLTSHAILRRQDRLDLSLAINGTIVLYPPHYRRPGQDLQPPAIGVIWAIVRDYDGPVHEHTEYKKIFNALKRSLRKLMLYETVHVGEPGPPTKFPMEMSERFARAAEAGAIKTPFRPAGRRKK